ncbi:hypothetical protein CRG98_001269 [Punica granatum]|uniref:Uncharacterized protein n=1 Tax=Punica granatum TaxID=22663 RepID=A0A2I0LDL9_PUNGR|nr:hypothetical protein CRG98_001269 [Punica granatum]
MVFLFPVASSSVVELFDLHLLFLALIAAFLDRFISGERVAFPSKGFRGFFWKAARIGERLSPWIAVGCFSMGVSVIFF